MTKRIAAILFAALMIFAAAFTVSAADEENDSLIDVEFLFTNDPFTHTDAAIVDGKTVCSVQVLNVETEVTVVVAGYVEGRLADAKMIRTIGNIAEVDLASADTDTIKVFVFESAANIKALSKGETVKL